MYDRSEISNIEAMSKKTTRHEPRYMKTFHGHYGTHCATEDNWREIKAAYYGMISRLDNQFGRELKKVDDLGISKDTVT
jgi:arylsulfatase A-like enzyme